MFGVHFLFIVYNRAHNGIYNFKILSQICIISWLNRQSCGSCQVPVFNSARIKSDSNFKV